MVYQTFQKFLTGNFHSIWLFLPEFLKFSVEWSFQKFNNFWKHSQKRKSVPFVSVSKFSEFLVVWKVPIVSHHLIAFLYPSESAYQSGLDTRWWTSCWYIEGEVPHSQGICLDFDYVWPPQQGISIRISIFASKNIQTI